MQPLFLVKLLDVPFFSYPTLIISGVALAWCAAQTRARALGWPALWVSEGFVCASLGAVGLGRIAHVIYNLDFFVERPTEIGRFADGGLALVGVGVGGCAGLWLWSRWRAVSFARVVMLTVWPLSVLASLAWLGAFWHGSQYGAPSEHEWALELRDTFGVVIARWPTQLWAAAWSAGCGLALWLWQQRAGPSARQALLCLCVYALGLCLLDFTRGDASPMWVGLRWTQWLYLMVSGVVFARGLGRSM